MKGRYQYMSNIFDQFLDELAAAEGLTVDAGETEFAENNEAIESNVEVENTETPVEDEAPATEGDETVEDAAPTEVEGEANTEDTITDADDTETTVTEEEVPTVDEAAEEAALLAGTDVAEESVTEVEIDPDEFLTEGMESKLLLDVLRETCTKEEFTSFINENKTELELYGLVNFSALATESFTNDDDDLEEATEARNIVRLNKQAQISREEARISIGLAKKSNDALYKYYHKYAELKRKFRDKIYEKYNGRARGLARKAVMNSRNKASVMNSKTGSTIINKIDSRIKDLDKKGRNNEAVKKPVR
jgi:hypothetical protein